jgi:hypothetical protein
VALTDAGGHTMPFRYAKASGMYVPHSTPTRISLAPGAHAYVKVSKYRCDLANGKAAATIQLTAAGVDVTPELPEWHSLASCDPMNRPARSACLPLSRPSTRPAASCGGRTGTPRAWPAPTPSVTRALQAGDEALSDREPRPQQAARLLAEWQGDHVRRVV